MCACAGHPNLTSYWSPMRASDPRNHLQCRGVPKRQSSGWSVPLASAEETASRATRAADVRVRRTPKSDELLVADARLGPPQPLTVPGGSEEAVVWLVGDAWRTARALMPCAGVRDAA